MTRIGVPELAILLVIVLLLFGPGRIAKMAGELGQGIRSFKTGLDDPTINPPENTAPADQNVTAKTIDIKETK